VEDCQVCCKPNVLRVKWDESAGAYLSPLSWSEGDGRNQRLEGTEYKLLGLRYPMVALPENCIQPEDDEEFATWCNRNRRGFFLNCYPPKKNGEITEPYMLHAAWQEDDMCYSLWNAQARKKLTAPYPKVCSTSAVALWNWATEIRGHKGAPKKCGKCNPQW
jgi:hypothetical protein